MGSAGLLVLIFSLLVFVRKEPYVPCGPIPICPTDMATEGLHTHLGVRIWSTRLFRKRALYSLLPYGVATVSRIDKIIGLFCKIWSLL